MINFKKNFLKYLGIFFIIFALVTFGFLIYIKKGKGFSVKGEQRTLLDPRVSIKNPSPFSGISCNNHQGRAFGVILAQYQETMPLSSISQADIVIEWPVANPGGITRLLAIFQCQNSQEIGSIRSGRPYIAEIAKGFDLIFVSWGGPDLLYKKIREISLDWLDAMENPSGAFFRKRGISSPHNGFTSFEKLKKAALDKKIRMENSFEGYKFLEEKKVLYKKNEQVINVAYYNPVKYVYDKNNGNYLRYWNNREVIDRNTQEQVFAKNVVLLKTNISILRPGIADVKIIGSGEAKIYQAGDEINCSWEKESVSAKLKFLDEYGEEIKFIPGSIWIEIVDKF